MTISNEEFKDTEEDTSRMEMAAAIAELSKEPAKEEVKEPAKEEIKEEAKEEVKEEAKEEVKEGAKEEVKEEAREPLLTQDKAPVGWSPKMRERWGTLDPDVRAEVLRREEASAQGVRQLQEQFAPKEQFINHLMPIIQEAVNHNVNPAQHITNVMEAERRLRIGTDNERFGALIEIAEGYGIPLKAILTEVLGKDALPQPAQKAQIPAEVQRELEEGRAFRQRMEAQQKAAPVEDPPQIKEFAKNHPYFVDVRDTMADLAEAGFSNDLETLYKEACWRNPGVREVLLEEERKPGALSEKQKAAAGLKVKSSNVSEMKSDRDHDDDDSLEDTIRKAIMSEAGRV